MDRERRAIKRKRPGELAYVQLGEDLGGIVWNASEAGLAFQSVTPMRGPRTIPICISPNPSKRIALTGTLAWADETGKIGGLQFDEVSPAIREQLRKWLEGIPGPSTAVDEFPFQAQQEDMATGRPTDAPETMLDQSFMGVRAKVMPSSDSLGPVTTSRTDAILCSPQLVSSTPPALRWSRRNPIGLSTVIMLCCVAAAAPIAAIHYFRSGVAHALIRIGETLQGNRTASASSSPSLAASEAKAHFRALSTSPRTDLERPSVSVSSRRIEPSSNRGTIDAGGPLESNLPEHQPVSNNRNERRVIDGRSAAAKALWNAIGRGDVSAEVSLARLYLNGDGVPRSCEQARVLLKAAFESGNSEAAKLLKNLRKAGCR